MRAEETIMAANNATTSIDAITQTTGNDTLLISSSDVMQAEDQFDGDAGTDTIVISAPVGGTIDLRPAANAFTGYEAMSFSNSTGSTSVVQLDASQFGAGGGLLPMNLTLWGSTGAQTIQIFAANNFNASTFSFALSTWTDAEDLIQIFGTEDADTLVGSIKRDRLEGGAGDDTYTVNLITDAVVENADEGTDTVNSSVTNTLAANVENLTLTGTLLINGTGNDLDNTLTGNAAANQLFGLGGNDILNGGLGGDKMTGGTGNDTYYIDSSKDSIVELVDGGTDQVITTITHKLGANVENLTLAGTSGISGTGNALNNTITGNSGNNNLNGGVGADTLKGGLGNDIYVVDNLGDTVTEYLDEGIDTVQSALSYALGDNLENLTLSGSLANSGYGNELNNKIVGNGAINTLNGGEGNDTLDGGKGADILDGGVGDDTYIVDNAGDVIMEMEGESSGIDTVISSISNMTGLNVENLTLTGTAITASGNGLDNVLTGNKGNNTLYGYGGNDKLDGANGVDKMYGGIGDDSYYVNTTGELTVELDGEGTDTVYSTITHTLQAYVENLTIIGTIAATANGNGLDNVLTGNKVANSLYGFAGSDVLDGAGGADKMYGGDGWDTYFVDHASDLVVELANQGYDSVNSTISYTLTANVENLTLLGTANINATGNAESNLIVGNSGNNVITSGTDFEVDYLHGKGGNDTYYVGVMDNVYEDEGEGTDTVYASGSFALASGQAIEALVLSGTSATNGYGNEFANAITGNSAANILRGNGGADSLTGGSGNDTFDFNTLSDSVAATGIDSITDFTIGDKIDVSDIDANALLEGDQAFVMDGDGNYTAGELKVTGLGNNNLRLDFHTDDDGVADMTINVHVNSTLNVTYINELNFVL